MERRKAVATHEKLSPRFSLSDIVGNAVLVTVPSRAESKRGMQMLMKARQKPRPLFHFSGVGMMVLDELCERVLGGSVVELGEVVLDETGDELCEVAADGSGISSPGRRGWDGFKIAAGMAIGFNDCCCVIFSFWFCELSSCEKDQASWLRFDLREDMAVVSREKRCPETVCEDNLRIKLVPLLYETNSISVLDGAGRWR